MYKLLLLLGVVAHLGVLTSGYGGVGYLKQYWKCKREAGCKEPEGPDELMLCPLNETICGDAMNMTCTNRTSFTRGLTLTDTDGAPVGVCVTDTVDFKEGLFCCKPGCDCPSGGECSDDVVGNFSTEIAGVCVGGSTPEECTSHGNCTDLDAVCVQGNTISYCLVPQSRPEKYECSCPKSSSSSSSEESSSSSHNSKPRGPWRPRPFGRRVRLLRGFRQG